MRKYENEQDVKLIQVICNRCGKKLKLENGYLKEACFQADHVFGYFSNKDGIRHCFDLCEDCYDKMVENFKIPVEESQENELM